jgi:proteasome lid subunit RPN8/RPN11
VAIFIPERLKELVEGWIIQSDRNYELGGTFFGTETEFKSFLPIPNFSTSPRDTYERGNGKYFEKEFSKMIGYSPIAGMHTHPNGSIPSEQDCKYIRSHGQQFEVVIADMGDEFNWFCFNKQLQHENLFFKDIDLEKSVLCLAQSFQMMDLGRCMVTPSGELLCENKKGQDFLKFDSDTFRVWNWLDAHKGLWRKTKTQIREDTGLSLKRVNDSLKILGIEKL